MGAEETRRLPFTVIGGYLGAGKTTLLNALLADAGGRRLAVLVNDFGSLAIDAALVRRHDGETIDLASGCMCCSLAGGFGEAIGRVLERASDFDHVVIEASGVAEPDRVVGWGLTHGLVRDAVLVVADAERVRERADDRFVGDVVRRQLRAADLVVLNKADLVPPATLADVRAWIEGIVPGARILDTVGARVPADVVLGPSRAGRVGDAGGLEPTGFTESVGRLAADVGTGTPSPTASGDVEDRRDLHDHARVFDTWTVVRATPLPRRALEEFAASLPRGVHRAKGFVRLTEPPSDPLVFQQVGRRWSLEPMDPRTPPRPDAPAVELVLIGHRAATSAPELDALLGAPDPSPSR